MRGRDGGGRGAGGDGGRGGGRHGGGTRGGRPRGPGGPGRRKAPRASGRGARDTDAEGLPRRFEGEALLAELLAASGSALSPDAVLARFRAARSEDLAQADVVPTLWDGPPRFGSPELARRTFENLLGLWDASADPAFQLRAPAPRPRRVRPEPPGRFGPDGPDAPFLAALRAWLAEDAVARRRLTDSFENRQDALLLALDERGLSDEGWGVLRRLALELHASLELTDGAAPARVPPEALEGDSPAPHVPGPLLALVDAWVTAAEQDGVGPVPEAERVTVLALGRSVVSGLWSVRADRGSTSRRSQDP